jgi:surface polysaccharide O-acyltransferase-like enzyme
MMKPEEKIIPGRNRAMDALRTAAILAVILIHTTSRTIESVYMNLPKVPLSLLLNQVSRFAVPLFFLISGFVLELSYRDDIGYFTYLKKRAGKIFLPYVFWSFIYYQFVYTQHDMGFLQTLIGGNSSYQLYFIPPLLLFYLIFPLLHKLYRWISKWWVLVILIGTEIGLLYADYYRHAIVIPDPLRITVLNYLFFVLGMVACHQTDRILAIVRQLKYFWPVITAVLAGYIFYEGGSRYLASWNYIDFYSQWRPSIAIYTLVLFAGGYYWFTNLKYKENILTRMSGQSFFVFFVHVWVLEIIWKLFIKYLFADSPATMVTQVWFDPLFFGLTAMISFSAAYLIHKIAWVSKLTG